MGRAAVILQMHAARKRAPRNGTRMGKGGKPRNSEFHNCLNCVYNCDDQPYIHIFLRSSNI